MNGSFSFAMEMGFGAFRGALPLPEGDLTLAEFTRNVFQLAEQINQQAVDVATSDGQSQITCGPGCGACCRQAVPVSIPEAMVLSEWVKNETQTRRNELFNRFAEIHQRLAAAHLDLSAQPGETQDARWRRFSAPYFSLNLPCPFLEEESCSIYSLRPTVCRDFLVTSPAQECADITSEAMVCIDMPVSLPHCLSRLAGILMDEEPHLIPLPLALEWVEAHHEWQSKRFEAHMLYATFFDIVKAQADLWRGSFL